MATMDLHAADWPTADAVTCLFSSRGCSCHVPSVDVHDSGGVEVGKDI